MAAITPAIGAGMYVEVNGSVVKAGQFRRNRKAGEIELPVSGLEQDADGNYELPHDVGFIKTTITISAPYDQDAPFHNSPYDLRAGMYCTARFGMTSTLLTPEAQYAVMDTTDGNEASIAGRGDWEAVLMPIEDAAESSPGYYTEAS